MQQWECLTVQYDWADVVNGKLQATFLDGEPIGVQVIETPREGSKILVEKRVETTFISLHDMLNQLGKEGWEPVGISDRLVLLKRPIL